MDATMDRRVNTRTIDRFAADARQLADDVDAAAADLVELLGREAAYVEACERVGREARRAAELGVEEPNGAAAARLCRAAAKWTAVALALAPRGDWPIAVHHAPRCAANAAALRTFLRPERMRSAPAGPVCSGDLDTSGAAVVEGAAVEWERAAARGGAAGIARHSTRPAVVEPHALARRTGGRVSTPSLATGSGHGRVEGHAPEAA